MEDVSGLYALINEKKSGPFPIRYLDAPPEPTKWLVPDLIASGTCGILAAEPKAGKTWLTFALGISLATGRSLLGEFTPETTGRTLLYSPEGGWASRTQRLWGLCWGEDIQPQAVIESMPFVDARLNLADGGAERLAETIDQIDPRLVVIDPLVSAHIGLDENSSGEMMEVLSPLRDIITARPNCALLVVHHHGKGNQRTLNHGLRGSSALGGWWDTLITMRRESDDSASPRRIDVEHRDAAAPPPVGFELATGWHDDAPGLSWFRLDRCETPEMSGGGNSRAAKSAKKKVEVLEFIAGNSGKYTRRATAKMMNISAHTVNKYVTELMSDGMVTLEDSGRLVTL